MCMTESKEVRVLEMLGDEKEEFGWKSGKVGQQWRDWCDFGAGNHVVIGGE